MIGKLDRISNSERRGREESKQIESWKRSSRPRREPKNVNKTQKERQYKEH